LELIGEGIGEKITMFFFNFATFAGALVSALVHGWELTLVIAAAMPVSGGHLFRFMIIGQEELVSCSSDYSTRWLAIK
jgi:hypothetical protein